MDKAASLLGKMKLLTFEINESSERIKRLKRSLKRLYAVNAIGAIVLTGGLAALLILGLYKVAILLAVLAAPAVVILWGDPMSVWVESLKDRISEEDREAYEKRRDYIETEIEYDYHLLAGGVD